ncbi:MAG: CoA transferase [Pseudomonadota bacterium]|nr:MAG: CoA transferase [Pseudomonadota bacterium]
MMGPLAGVRVIELAHIMSGPTCGMLLADMGADVIKVEKVPGGDDSRRFGLPTIQGESSAFLIMNRNKRGIALDLKQEAGREALKRLLRTADVVLENYRAGTMEKLGLGYETLRALNPGLIYCEISGYGRTGPYADKPGFDLIAQGVSGLMSITGEPGRPPIKCGGPVTDINAGILAAMGVLAAYIHRLKTGEGQRVDTSLMEAGIMQTYWHTAYYLATGEAAPPMGSGNLTSAPYQAFRTRDGWINIGAANQSNWERLLEALGAQELGDDPRFRTNADRMAHREELAELISERLQRHDTAHWLEVLDRAGLPVGPILSIPEMLAHPQTLARGMVVETEHPRAGRVRSLGLPVKFSQTPGTVRRPAPLLGEHTYEVLQEVGYSRAEIDALVAQGAAVAA